MTKMTDLLSSIAKPPVYREGNSYEEYTRDLDIWLLLKVATKAELGPILFRTLTPRAKASCRDLSVEQVGSPEGFDLIRKRLDKLYLNEVNQRIFATLDTFEKFRRTGDMSINNFIIEFENLHNMVKSHNITYPDGVLAYRLIKAANLSSEHEKLCRATVETGKWTYEAVIDQLKKIFSENITIQTSNQAIKLETAYHTSCANCKPSGQVNFDRSSPEYNNVMFEEDYIYDQQESDTSIEEEFDVLYTPYYRQNNNQGKYKQPPYKNSQNFRRMIPQNSRGPFSNNNSRQFANKYIDDRPPTKSEYKSLKDLYNSDPCVPNPKDSKGNFTVCRRCRSTYHWLVDCPHNETEKQNSSNTYFTRNLDEEVYIALL